MASTANTLKSGWSEGEKYTLLLKMIQQLTESGGKLNIANLDLPGRTPKACSRMIAKIKAEAVALSTSSGSPGSPSTPASARKGQSSKAASGRGQKLKAPVADKNDSEDDYDDDAIDFATPTPKRAKSNKSHKSVKKEEDVYDEDEEDTKDKVHLQEFQTPTRGTMKDTEENGNAFFHGEV
ncbi:hypothetical protein BX600DRAFT_504619 [Xylariales sp. PMI_506]|nr:hypothetical protein BX600DRAFT_504619 [Xylariales sp. PMI_506]